MFDWEDLRFFSSFAAAGSLAAASRSLSCSPCRPLALNGVHVLSQAVLNFGLPGDRILIEEGTEGRYVKRELRFAFSYKHSRLS